MTQSISTPRPHTKTKTQPEVIPPPEKLPTFRVGYIVQLQGEYSGTAQIRGEVLRDAADSTTAKHDVFTYLTKSQLQMYPVAAKSGIKLVTPEFPPEFNGRPLKTVTVWVESNDQVEERDGQAQDSV